MGFRFRRSIKVIPGIRINLGKSGFSSVSVGGHGITKNFSKKGTKTTFGLPGTGLSYSTDSPRKGGANQPLQAPTTGPSTGRSPVWARAAFIAAVIIAFIAYLVR
jgi:hypothetical protein